MASSRSRTSPPVRLTRVASRYVSLGGVGLIVIWAVERLIQPHPTNALWLCGVAVITILLLILAIFSTSLGRRSIRMLWVTIPTAGMVLQLTSVQANLTAVQPTYWNYTWPLTSVFLCLLLLRYPHGRQTLRVVGFAAVFAIAPAASWALTFHEFPAEMQIITILQFCNFVYPLLLSQIARRVQRFRETQERWHARSLRQAVARERLRVAREMSRTYHDVLLGALNAALLTPGATSDLVRAQARQAIALLADDRDEDGGVMSLAALGDALRSAAHAIDAEARITVTAARGDIAERTGMAILGAVSEALKNSKTHASEANRTLSASLTPSHIDVLIADDGGGFDVDRVPQDRLGVRESIVARMRDVDGGHARVETAPGEGTSIMLGWAADAAKLPELRA